MSEPGGSPDFSIRVYSEPDSYELPPSCSECIERADDVDPAPDSGWIYADNGWICPRCYAKEHAWKCASCNLYTIAELPEDSGWDWIDHRPVCPDCQRDHAFGKLRFCDYPRDIRDIAAKDYAIRTLHRAMSDAQARLGKDNLKSFDIQCVSLSLGNAMREIERAQLKHRLDEDRKARARSKVNISA